MEDIVKNKLGVGLFRKKSNIYVFYTGGIFLGLCVLWTTTAMVGSIAGRWCKENKATVIAMIYAVFSSLALPLETVMFPIIKKEIRFQFRVKAHQ